jgi:hypothetical protein
MIVPHQEMIVTTTANYNSLYLSCGTSWSVLYGPNLLVAIGDNQNDKNKWSGFDKDQVVRILDANTIKLKKNGIVTLAGVRMPTPGSSGNFHFPECISYTPAYKLRQLLPTNSDVLVKLGATSSTGKLPQAILVKSEDGIMVNQELVRTGFGKVQKVPSVDLEAYLDVPMLQGLQDRAKTEGMGIFQRCDIDDSRQFEAQFEPLDVTAEIQWGDDGGKLVLRQKEGDIAIPKNPGDIKGKNGRRYFFALVKLVIHRLFSCIHFFHGIYQDVLILPPMKMLFVGTRVTSHTMATWQNSIAMGMEYRVLVYRTRKSAKFIA